MEIISAENAKRLAEQAKSQIADNELASIFNLIDEAINRGECRIEYDDTMCEYTKRRLENLGYKVKTMGQHNEYQIVIDWSKENNA